MPALKQVVRNRRIKLSNGKLFSLKPRPEPPATVYFGVAFKDGRHVFMPRRIGTPSPDLAGMRAYALRVRGMDDDSEITGVAQACNKCARSIPGCTGCAFSKSQTEAGQDPKES